MGRGAGDGSAWSWLRNSASRPRQPRNGLCLAQKIHCLADNVRFKETIWPNSTTITSAISGPWRRMAISRARRSG
ncbi:HNH endonuclease [Novosphingobium sp.]|uniref:HNH endonuclease n=1 Tax=Novosphingobium sp. TaxID=1874826 RepID=UPI003459E87E